MEAPATPPGRSRVWGAAGDVCGERARSFAPTPLPSPVPFVNGPANVFGPESGPNPVPTRQAAFCCGLVVRSRRGSHPFTLSKALTPTPVATTTLLSAGQGRSCGPKRHQMRNKTAVSSCPRPDLGLAPPPAPPSLRPPQGTPLVWHLGGAPKPPPAGASCRPLGGCARAAARAHAADGRRLLGLAAAAAACRRRSSAATATVVLRGSRRPDARQVALSQLPPGSPLCLRVCFFVRWCDSRRRAHTSSAGWRRRQQFLRF